MCYDIETLKRNWQAGEKFRFLFFWGHTPPEDERISRCCLSQWWMAGFEADGVKYSCAEQFMMAQKARLFGDQEMCQAIMTTRNPNEMKALGRAVRGFDKARWDSACYDVVLRASLCKFGQNPELGAFLSGTGKRILVEASPRDRIWGIGMGESSPDAQNPMKWRGRNLLGFALTQARDQLSTGA